MPRTPDRVPGPSEEEATLYEDTSPATVVGEQRYNTGAFSLYDGQGAYNPRHTSITGADTTAGTLDTKITVVGNLTKAVINPGGDEKLQLTATGVPATAPGQVLYSLDGVAFTAQLPVTSWENGWLINMDGLLLVAGI